MPDAQCIARRTVRWLTVSIFSHTGN